MTACGSRKIRAETLATMPQRKAAMNAEIVCAFVDPSKC
jgi:hypothetical protein